eukprot:349715-Chlamydomonas_euryale.AAC.12
MLGNGRATSSCNPECGVYGTAPIGVHRRVCHSALKRSCAVPNQVWLAVWLVQTKSASQCGSPKSSVACSVALSRSSAINKRRPAPSLPITDPPSSAVLNV